MAQHASAGDDNGVDLDTDDELEIDNFQFSPSSSPLHSSTSLGVAGTTSSSSSPCKSTPNLGIADKTVARFIEMGFSDAMISRAIEETGGNKDPTLILETLFKYSSKTSSEAGPSKSKVIDNFIAMGFTEELVLKAIQENGEENMEEITNTLLNYTEAEKLHETENDDIDINLSSDDNDDDSLYSGLLSSDEEGDLDSRLRALVKMDYTRQEASTAIERCGENASLAEVIDFICAAQMARQFDEFSADPIEEELRINTKKRRIEKGRKLNNVLTNDDELIRLPNPMIGFGVPNEPGNVMERPVPLPEVASGPPYFYYENVALAPKGVWAKISSHLYEILPEFVDSKYFCAAARKRGYIHNLPIKNRFQLQPPPKYTIHEAFPLTKRWWPAWDVRTKLNCLLGSIASAQMTNRIRVALEKHDGEGEPALEVQKAVIEQCRKWNLVWVGRNKVAPLEPDEMEKLLGFPKDHTRGGGSSRTERYKSLGNSFQVDTVAYHLSVLKPLFPNGINVLSLFTGIGGGEVALHRLQIPMNVVVSVEISEVNRNILSSFWQQTNQKGVLIEFTDVQELDSYKIEHLMDRYGAFDLVIGGSPCNNLSGGNRVTRNGLEGEQSSLFYDYCRILEVVRHKAATMRR